MPILWHCLRYTGSAGFSCGNVFLQKSVDGRIEEMKTDLASGARNIEMTGSERCFQVFESERQPPVQKNPVGKISIFLLALSAAEFMSLNGNLA